MAAGKSIVLVVLLTATVAACTQGRDDSVLNTLTARVERLEQRVALADKRSELTVLTQRLTNLETRLAAAEAKGVVAERPDSTTPPANVNQPADSGSTVRLQSSRTEAVRERSQRFKSVAQEDRARVAGIREQFRDNPDPAARRQAMSEVRAWRRAQVDAMGPRGNAGEEVK